MIETVWPAKPKIFTVRHFAKENFFAGPSTSTTAGFPSQLQAGQQGNRCRSGPMPWLLPVFCLDSLLLRGDGILMSALPDFLILCTSNFDKNASSNMQVLSVLLGPTLP